MINVTLAKRRSEALDFSNLIVEDRQVKQGGILTILTIASHPGL